MSSVDLKFSIHEGECKTLSFFLQVTEKNDSSFEEVIFNSIEKRAWMINIVTASCREYREVNITLSSVDQSMTMFRIDTLAPLYVEKGEV